MQDNKALVILGIMLLFLLSGCATTLKLGGAERKSLHYGYGEEGEFFYLQRHNRDSLRFKKLAEKYIDRPLQGKDEVWGYKCSKEEVLSGNGEPINISSYVGNDGYSYEEWHYKFYVLVFKNGKLSEVKSTGRNNTREYIWMETWYTK